MSLRASFSVATILTTAIACTPHASSPNDLPPPPDPRATPPVREDDPAGYSRSRAATAPNAPKGANGPGSAANAANTAMPISGMSTSPAVELATGNAFSCARNAIGEVWCWGYNDIGEVGDGLRSYSSAPKRVPLPARAVRMSVGDPSCAILADGTVACWGGWSKAYGAHNSEPVHLIAGLHDIVFASSEGHGSRRYFIARDGTVFETVASNAPTVMPAFAGAEEIAQSENEVCARMRVDKSVRCAHWESGPIPPQPKRTTASRTPPPPVKRTVVMIGPTTVPSLAGASLEGHCAILPDRSVRCWGDNNYGQVGDGTTTERTSPTAVLNVKNAVQVSHGLYVSCALIADGTARCWGDSKESPVIVGQTRRLYVTPIAVSLPLKNIAEIHIGIMHACARTTDGRVACWGENRFQQVGDGSKEIERLDPSFVLGFGRTRNATEPTTPPTPAPPGPPTQMLAATDITAAANTTCARMSDGSPRCWGKNDDGQLGDGTHDDQSRPVASPYLASVSSIQTGGDHTCAIGSGADAGAVFCWGVNVLGELGQGNDAPERVPVRVPGLTNVKQIAMSSWSCALLQDGTVKCWGDWDSGAGDPGPSGSKAPTVINGAVGMVEIAATGSGGCGRTTAGDIRCFGWGSIRALSGGRTPKRTAVSLSGISHATSIAAGDGYCAVVTGGNVFCWRTTGSVDVNPALAADGSVIGDIPVLAKGYDHALDLGMGPDGSCARNQSRDIACWEDKKLTRPALHDVAKVVHGESHACALLANGEVHCWGKNDFGQLGDGTTTAHAMPARVLF